MHPSFLAAPLGRTGLSVFRLGLSASYRPGVRTVERALAEGVNCFFAFGFDTQVMRVLRPQPPRVREHQQDDPDKKTGSNDRRRMFGPYFFFGKQISPEIKRLGAFGFG